MAKNSLYSSKSDIFIIRGGASNENVSSAAGSNSSQRNLSTDSKFIKLSDPAPGSPFHLAMPVHDLDIAKEFYGNILGCAEGRSSEKWQDYSLHGHQIVCHWVGNDYRCQDYFNPVDGDEVPVPHFGLALTEEQFHALAKKLKDAGVEFIIPPHLRFKGQPGEQWTMFFKDPSGNNLEFKSMTTIENLFAKYNVVD
jgi:extradiol dioxygenase family protein